MLAYPLYLAWVGRASLVREGLGHYQIVPEQERRLGPEENLADPAAVAAPPLRL
jgi:hypothetical protein